MSLSFPSSLLRVPEFFVRSLGWVLFWSGLGGFFLGAFFFPVWQHAVEGAQVVSGLVIYPPDNAFYFYQAKIWTLLHQFLAVFLRLGVSEFWLSTAVSGVMGAAAYQALAAITYSISKDGLFAVFCPLLMHVTGAVIMSSTYPIYLMGMMATYGTLSFMLWVLATALIASERFWTGAFLLGLLPSIHPGVGILANLISGAACFIFICSKEKISWNLEGRRILSGWGAGAGLSLLSLGVHFFFTYPHSFPGAGASRMYVDEMIRALGCHREAIEWTDRGLQMNLALSMLSGFFLIRSRDSLPKGSRYLLTACALAGVVSFASVILSRIPPEALPKFLILLMPQRVLNFNIFLMAPLVLSLYRLRAKVMTRFRFFFILAAAGLWTISRYQKLEWMFAALMLMSLILIALEFGMKISGREDRSPATQLEIFIMIGLFIFYHGGHVLSNLPERIHLLERVDLDPVVKKLRGESGVVATSNEMERTQLVTRKPILLDLGALDMLPYAEETGALVFDILKDVYDIRLSTELDSTAKEMFFVDPDFKQSWESRKPEQWGILGGRFGFSLLLVPPDWKLDAERIAVSRRFALYRILQGTGYRVQGMGERGQGRAAHPQN